MNKFKRFGVSILSLGLVLALNPVTTFAAEPETSVVTSESNAIGGWSEEDGYFVNPQAYSKAMEDGTTYASPKHTGKAEERTHNGTSQKRAHGWTTWVGKYHYTRARMEDWGAILTDSGRQWGTVESASGAVQTGDHTTHSQIDQFISKWFRICHPQVFSELF